MGSILLNLRTSKNFKKLRKTEYLFSFSQELCLQMQQTFITYSCHDSLHSEVSQVSYGGVL